MGKVSETDIRNIAKELNYLPEDWQLSRLSSFTVVELLIQIEKHYNVYFEHGEWEELLELCELVDLVNKKLSKFESAKS